MTALLAVLALLAGVASGVTAHPAETADNDTNSSFVIAAADGNANETTAINGSNATVPNGTDTAASEYTRLVAVGVNGSGAVDGDSGTDLDAGADAATDAVRSTVDGSDPGLADRTALIERLERTDSDLLELRGTVFVGPDGEATRFAGLNRLDAEAVGNVPAGTTANRASWREDSTAAGSRHLVPISEGSNTGSGQPDHPDPLAGLTVGLQVAVAGVALRELTDLPAPARTALRAGRNLFDRIPRLFVPLRYSRYDDSDPLEHEDRATVFRAIEDSPGVYLTELSDRTEVSLSTLRHHVRVLEREDVIAAARVRGRRRFYPADTEDLELAAAINDEATAPLVDALARLGAVTVSDLAEEDGRDASTVTHHLQRLESDGLVVREREGRAIVNRLASQVREALAPLGETHAETTDRESVASAD